MNDCEGVIADRPSSARVTPTGLEAAQPGTEQRITSLGVPIVIALGWVALRCVSSRVETGVPWLASSSLPRSDSKAAEGGQTRRLSGVIRSLFFLFLVSLVYSLSLRVTDTPLPHRQSWSDTKCTVQVKPQ